MREADAPALAEARGARWSTGERDLLADPDVEVAAICSTPGQHARQILAAVAAGIPAIFCERPLATFGECRIVLSSGEPTAT